MKKKIFNALLMGALVVTSMSVFVSCKDYDDDIDSLKLEQADLLSQLESLNTEVSSKLNTVTSDASKAQTTADEALKTAQANGANIEGLKTSITAAATAAEEAGAAATKAQTTASDAAAAAKAADDNAAAAQKTADDAATAAKAAQTTADEALAEAKAALEEAKKATSSSTASDALAKAESALISIGTLQTQVGNLETLTADIPALKTAVENAVTKEQLEAVQEQVGDYQNIFDNLFTMITSVELFGTYNGNFSSRYQTLNFVYGTVTEDSKFGDNEAYTTASPEIAYIKDAEIKPIRTVLLRVNPVNATLSTTDVNNKILFVNSKGEALDDYIEVVSVSKYDDVLTRASKIESGLWKVDVQLKDDVDHDAFNKTVTDGNKNVLYAVAVNNTDTLAADRFVASTYDLQMSSKEYAPETELSFKVNDKNVGVLKNRWNGKKIVLDQGITTGDPKEYTWKTVKGDVIPYTAMVTGGNGNVVEDGDDARSNYSPLAVQLGEDITVSFDGITGADNIDRYYVVLDKNFALESGTSEWQAWEKYAAKIENLGVTKKASEDLTLKVNDEGALGDVIGFRVFAVNFDGTLVDPDGKAFYVTIGEPATTASVSGTVTVGDDNTAVIALDKTFESCGQAVSGIYGFNVTSDIPFSTTDQANAISEAKISWQLTSDDKGQKSVSNWKDAKYIKVKLDTPEKLVDDATFSFTIEAKTGYQTINKLTVNVTKNLPTEAGDHAVSFVTGQVKDGVYNCYVNPTSWTEKQEEAITTKLSSIVNENIENSYKWSVAKAAENGKDKQEISGTGDLEVYPSLVDSKTPRTATLYYSYGQISMTKDKSGDPIYEEVKVVAKSVDVIYSSALNNNLMSYKFDVKDNGKTGNQKVEYTLNHIVFNPNAGATTATTAIDANGTEYIETGETTAKEYTYAGVLKSVNSLFPGFNGKAWNAAETAEFYYSIENISLDNSGSKYYTVSWDKTNEGVYTLAFTLADGHPTVLQEDITCNLNIKVKDAFNKSYTYSVPFKILKQK